MFTNKAIGALGEWVEEARAGDAGRAELGAYPRTHRGGDAQRGAGE